ncbi:MAG TPA: pyridoxal-phosphate dependent enzyme [Polyangiaceae bacterium]
MAADPIRTRALFRVFAGSREPLPWAKLGEFPTPVTPFPGGGGIPENLGFVKRDDLSSPVYGGNKVRTLEALFGAALARESRTIIATGAYGSNHAVATALHAPRVGLSARALLFPQPVSWAALENLRVTLALSDAVQALPHWSCLPFSMWHHARRRDLGGVTLMPPGGACPRGALGYVSAAFELAEQIEAGVLPAPARIVIGIGSTCTTAGLLVGLELAKQLGLGFRATEPALVAVRVTPWPVTSRWRILRLAERTARLLAAWAQDPALAVSAGQLGERLELDAGYLGRGYGRVTETGRAAMRRWTEAGLPQLDTTYSAKSAAAFLARCERAEGPTLFWSTKSSAPLPGVSAAQLSQAPRRALRWIVEAERNLPRELPAGYERREP